MTSSFGTLDVSSNPSGHQVRWVVAITMAVIAIGLRVIWHHDRPLHTDEAVNAWRIAELLMTDHAPYRPMDGHGPTFIALMSWCMKILGVHDLASMEAWQLRLGPALAGGALLLTIPVWMRWFPVGGVFTAGIWWTLSAPIVYVGGSAIHESLFVLITMLVLLAGARWWSTGSMWWAFTTGGLIGTLIATKETALITGLVLLVSLVISVLTTNRKIPAEWRKGVIGGLLGLIIAVFVWFLDQSGGVMTVLAGWREALGRAGHEGHMKPWWWYGGWLLTPNPRAWPWAGWTLTTCALIGGWHAWRHRNNAPMWWFMTVLTMATTVAYMLIPYKTPWLALNFLVPGALVAGLGAHVLMSGIVWRWRWILMLGIGMMWVWLLARESDRLVRRFATDSLNPLAYAHTVPDCVRLAEMVAQEVAQHPGIVQVISDDPWPLPWYFRRVANVGYWNEMPAVSPSQSIPVTVVVAIGAAQEPVAARLGSGWRGTWFGVRPEVLATVFVPVKP